MKMIDGIFGAKRFVATFVAVAWLSAFCLPAIHADEAPPKGHYTLTGATVIPIDKTDKGFEKSERLTRGIRFDIQARYKIVPGTEGQAFKILNPTVASKSKLTFDKPIKFKGEVVPAGANVLKYQQFDGSFFNVYLPDPHPFAIHSAVMKHDFALPADSYTVKLEWTTAQGEVFSDTVKVYIDVDLSAKQ